METFDWVPLANPQARYRHQTFRARFGEGYTQAAGAGINSRYDEWPLTFQGSRAMIEDIQNFLDRHQGFRPFRWFPPLGTGAGLYDADEYSISVGPGGCANYTLSVTFRLRKRMYAPTNSALPVVSGLHQIGQVIAVSQGSWESEYPMQFEYQWLRNGEPIAGATGQNYTLVDDDLFDMISVRVTASSLGGSTSVETDPVLARLDAEVSWLYSDMAETIFVDVDGNTPATWGDPVGLIRDASPNRADFTQPTVTARPILGRVPRGGRRNEAVVSEGFNWTANNSAVVTYDGENPYGVTPSASVVTAENTRSSGVYRNNLLGRVLPAGTEITVSIRLKPILMTSPLRVALEGSAFPNTPIANIDLDSHTVNPLNSFASWRLGEGEDGFFVAEATMTPSADGTINISIYNQNENTGSNEFLITALQVEFSETASPYQSVLSAYDITEAGVPEIHYLSFDLTDDNLTTTLPAIENGTVVIAGTGGIWIDDDYNFDGGTFSIGPTSYTNGPEGILTAIGEPIVGGFLVINRQLSQLERDLVIQEMKERGAPGVLRVGPELMPNSGGPFVDTAGFTARNNTTLDVVDGQLTISRIDVEAAHGTDSFIDIETGAHYLLDFEITPGDIYSGVPDLYSGTLLAQEGINRRVITGDSSRSRFSAATTANQATPSFSFAYISVRKLELIP